MVECPLCGFDNKLEAQKCYICDTELAVETELQATRKHDIIVDTVDSTNLGLNWKKMGILFLVIVLFLIPSFLIFDLFLVPEGVKKSRVAFTKLKESYLSNKESWNFQKGQILSSMSEHRHDDEIGKEALHFDNIPLEILMAFFMEDLKLSDERFHDFVLYPEDDGLSQAVILSKYEERLWPLPVIVSLKVRFSSKGEGFHPQFVKLYRGDREVPIHFAWSYFGEELGVLRCLESFSGGILKMKLLKKSKEHDKNEMLTGPLELSWEYLHRGIL